MIKRPLVGFTVQQYKGFTPSIIVSALSLVGVEFVEISRDIFSNIDQVIKVKKKIKTGFHLPLIHDDGWDFSCPEYETNIIHTIKNINTYHRALNIQYAVTHPPEIGDSKKSSFDYLIQNLAKLKVPVYFENVPSISQPDFEIHYEKAKEKLENLAGICYDAAHYYLSGQDPIQIYHKIKPNIQSIHLSDCLKDDDAHLPFGMGGQLPIKNILHTLQKDKFNGYITLEIMPRTFKDIHAFLHSYLTVLKYLDYPKYIQTRIRLFVLKPIINKFIS
jgi:sugar phosphate isomerase/epimerase